MKAVLFAVVLVLGPPAGAAPPQRPEPRFVLRVDVGMLALPNVGMEGGGGIEIPFEAGTGAGLLDSGGAEIGLEVRLSRWLALDAGLGRYGPTLDVERNPGPGETLDARSAHVDLHLAEVGLVIAPPRLRSRVGRLAFSVLVVRSAVSDVPQSLGVAVEDHDTGLGVDVRGEIFLSKNRRWGIGGALIFSDIGPGFTDLETGFQGTLQVSGVFLRAGLRGAW